MTATRGRDDDNRPHKRLQRLRSFPVDLETGFRYRAVVKDSEIDAVECISVIEAILDFLGQCRKLLTVFFFLFFLKLSFHQAVFVQH